MIKIFITLTTLIFTFNNVVYSNDDIDALRKEINDMKNIYEDRINDLENKLSEMEKDESLKVKSENIIKTRKIYGNEFNPSIGIVFNGRYNNFSEKTNELAGFAIGHEGERGRQGSFIGETEMNFSSNIDDSFYGSFVPAIVKEDGDTKVELEEAFITTTPGANLPDGLAVKFGRAFWTLGYMNEHHAHSDDFADRPLPYRAYLNKAFNDDGLEVTYVLPTDFYFEVGGGAFRGDDFPAGTADGENLGAWSAFARTGGDIDANQNWRVGIYTLNAEADGTAGRKGNEDEVTFIGNSDLYVVDIRYVYTPTGNAREQEIALQGEFFARNEDGTYSEGTAYQFNGTSYGWYAQGTMKLNPQWRVGARYSQLEAPAVPLALIGSAVDSSGHDPNVVSLMADWTNSEFSRIRFQANHSDLHNGSDDKQFIIQYVMSAGAHGAHKY
tara:strand:+ start:2479 stop:3801 length:1323 start_codon:yes stop_codon:yes gene_type:complete